MTRSWHGANWTFVIWGIYNGLIVLAERKLSKNKVYLGIPDSLKWFITMLLVIFGRVLFRSDNISIAWQFLSTMFGYNLDKEKVIVFGWRYYLNNRLIVLSIMGAILSTLPGTEAVKNFKNKLLYNDDPRLHLLQTLVLIILMILNISMIVSSNYVPFIYFQF